MGVLIIQIVPNRATHHYNVNNCKTGRRYSGINLKNKFRDLNKKGHILNKKKDIFNSNFIFLRKKRYFATF